MFNFFKTSQKSSAIILLISWTFCSSLLALGLDPNRPASFKAQNLGKAVFIDIQKAHYQIDYIISANKVVAISTIDFEMPEDGYPIIELKPEIEVAFIDGAKVNAVKYFSPNEEAGEFKVFDSFFKQGSHQLMIKNAIKENVVFSKGKVASGFWMSDLDRGGAGYLDLYLPSNFEFDQYEMTFEVNVAGSKAPLRVYSNGTVNFSSSDPFSFTIEFPAHFNTSMPFFHLSYEGRYFEKSSEFVSINGKRIPVIAYSEEEALTADLFQNAVTIFQELESTFGAWPHENLVIFGIGRQFYGGMEYAGATRTDLSALGHEMTHSYFARGFLPANGDAGWIDEALAKWRDNGYPRKNSFSKTANLGNRSEYYRTTHIKAYTHGMEFMSFIDSKLSSAGGLKFYLRKLIEEKIFTPMINNDFIKFLENESQVPLNSLFVNHVLNVNAIDDSELPVSKYRSQYRRVLGGLLKNQPEEGKQPSELQTLENPSHPYESKEHKLSTL